MRSLVDFLGLLRLKARMSSEDATGDQHAIEDSLKKKSAFLGRACVSIRRVIGGQTGELSQWHSLIWGWQRTGL
jgi:hypothetical protein